MLNVTLCVVCHPKNFLKGWKYRHLAGQSVEHVTLGLWVLGLSPTLGGRHYFKKKKKFEEWKYEMTWGDFQDTLLGNKCEVSTAYCIKRRK